MTNPYNGFEVTANWQTVHADPAGLHPSWMTLFGDPAAVGATNLNIPTGTHTNTELVVANSNGTGFTLATATGTKSGLMSSTLLSKLDGIASGATANASDAALIARANHTGTQPASTISDFVETAQDTVAAMLAPGTNISLDYNDAAGTLTINSTATGGGGTLTDLKIEGGTHTPGWVRAAAAPYNVTDAGTAANNVAGINAALATFGTTYTPLRALQPATVDLRGASISLDQGAWIRQDGVYLDLDGTRISGTAGTGSLFRFDGNTVNALNHVGIRGSAVLDGNARTGPIVEVTNTRFWYQTGGVLKVYDFAGDGLIFKGAVAPYSDGLHIRPAVEAGAAGSAPNSRGLVLTTSNLIPSGTGDTQRGVFVKPLIYDTGREGILVEGSGCHVFAFADVEACGVSGSGVTATGVRLSRSFGNQILSLYTEVNGVSGNGFRDILIDNTVASAGPASAVTNSTFNLILGGYLTGSVEIAAGQNNVISAASILGNLTIGAGADQTQLASGTLVVGTLTDNGTNTVKQFYSLNQPEMYIKSGAFKRWTHEVGSTVKIGSDYNAIQLAQIRGISGGNSYRNNLSGNIFTSGTSGYQEYTVTFATPEPNAEYDVFPSLESPNAGLPGSFLLTYKNRTTNGFILCFSISSSLNFGINWLLIGR